jgi:hypothetical protein
VARPLVAAAAAPLLAGIAWAVFRASGGLLSSAGAAVVEIGAAASLAVLAALVAAGVAPVPRVGVAAAVTGCALVAYAALALGSQAWALSPSAAHDEGLRTLAYAAAFGVGLLATAAAASAPVAALAAGGAIAAVACLFAVLDRALGPDRIAFTARLEGTLDNPNLLGQVAVVLLIAALALALGVERRPYREAGLALAGVAVLCAVLASSRSALALQALAAIVLVRRRGAPAVRLAPLAGLALALAAGLAAARLHAFSAPLPRAPSAGPVLLAAALAAAVAVPLATPLAAGALRRLPARAARGLDTGVREAAILGTAAAAALVASAGGSAVSSSAALHVTSFGANLRFHWWSSAWDAFTNAPFQGYGAGSFRIVEQLAGRPPAPTAAPHDLVLEALAGTGVVGGVLVLLVLGGAGAIAVARIRDRDLARAALALVAATFLAQALLDLTFGATAIGALAFAALGIAAVPAGDALRVPVALRPVAAVVCAGALGLAAAALPPWLAARAATRAARATSPRAALAAARDAQRVDDQLLGPLLVEADARLRLGDPAGARRALARAATLEPASYEVPLALARLEEATGNRTAAIAALRRSNLLSGGLPETRRALQTALAAGG